MRGGDDHKNSCDAGCDAGGIVRGRHSSVVGSEIGDARSTIEFPHSQKLPENAACEIAIFRNDAAQDALDPRARANQLACIMTRGAVRCETTYLPLQRLRQRYPRPRRHSRKAMSPWAWHPDQAWSRATRQASWWSNA